jgi:transposase
MRFVPNKSIEQQDLQALHRIRSRMIGPRTQLGNQIRGLLAEYSIVLPLHLSQVRKALPELIEEDNALLSGFGRQLLALLYEELCGLEQRIAAMKERIQQVHRSNPLCQKIAAVEGVGPVIATAVDAEIADGRVFHNGRQFAAWVGLVPRQQSSGDKQRLSGITKRGDPYLRMLLIHGARSVVYRAPKQERQPQPVDRGEAAQAGLKPLWRHVSTCRCIGSESPPNAIYSDGERIDQVEALGVLGQDWSEHACVSSSLLYEVRGKLQTQILCGADDNPRRHMSTPRSG